MRDTPEMPKLLVKEGPGRGDVFELSQEDVRIGRDLENDMRLADRAISRFHARISRREADCYVSDLDSHNGTLVNGEPIRRR